MHERGGKGRNRLRLLSLLLVLLVGSQLTGQFSITPSDQDDTATSGLQAQYAQLPLAFEPNQGQVDAAVQYLVHHGQATTYFTGTDTVTSIGDKRITMSLDGAANPSFTGTDELPSKTNYFIGNDQSKWRSDVSNYQGIFAKDVYPGIDLKYYGNNSHLEHDFIVSPGTDPKQIAFGFTGQKDQTLDANGNLVLKLDETELILQAPISYQEIDGGRQPVTSSFEVTKNSTVKITIGDYDKTRALTIDPVLIYSTYLGGGGDENVQDFALDASGNTYLTGITNSATFPTVSPYQASHAGSGDVFVSKFNPSGSALLYSTYVGGTLAEDMPRIAIDLSGKAYVFGGTRSTNFPTNNAYQGSHAGGTDDAFVFALNSAGTSLDYSTYLGGSSGDAAPGGSSGIAVDNGGRLYISGSTSSSNFPTLGAYDASYNGGAAGDVFISSFSANGSLVYSTYLGGTGNDPGGAIKIDGSGNMYVVGLTSSVNFPTSSPYQAANAGGLFDGFITKLNSAGSALVYSTYLGGTGDDRIFGIDLDSTGNVYAVGKTTSIDFPTSSPFQAANAGSDDGFILKLNAAGSALTHSTYFGGSGLEDLYDIKLDQAGNIFITGLTGSSNFPIFNAYQSTYGGGTYDAVISKFNPTLSALVYSTYIGGSGTDFSNAVEVSLNGNAYVAGYTSSTNFPVLSAYQSSNAGSSDAFLAQLTEHSVNLTATVDPYLTFTLGSTTCDLGVFSSSQTKFCTHTIAAASNATSGYVISYIPTTTLTSGANTITAMSSQTASVLGSEQFGFNLKANTAAGSFTATDFGSDPSGGSGVAMTGYELANQFKFAVGGDNIAQTTVPSNLTTFTVSFIANIMVASEAGLYSTPVTYNVVASY